MPVLVPGKGRVAEKQVWCARAAARRRGSRAPVSRSPGSRRARAGPAGRRAGYGWRRSPSGHTAPGTRRRSGPPPRGSRSTTGPARPRRSQSRRRLARAVSPAVSSCIESSLYGAPASVIPGRAGGPRGGSRPPPSFPPVLDPSAVRRPAQLRRRLKLCPVGPQPGLGREEESERAEVARELVPLAVGELDCPLCLDFLELLRGQHVFLEHRARNDLVDCD